MTNSSGWLRPKPKPDVPPDSTPGLTTYFQAWQKLKQIPIKKLFPGVTAVGAVVFFAISGVLAWLVLFVSFIVNLFKLLTVKLWRLFK